MKGGQEKYILKKESSVEKWGQHKHMAQACASAV